MISADKITKKIEKQFRAYGIERAQFTSGVDIKKVVDAVLREASIDCVKCVNETTMKQLGAQS